MNLPFHPERLPAEWEFQSGVQLTWPHRDTDWAERLSQVEPVFARIGAEIAQRERLLIVAQDAEHAAHVQALLCTVGAPEHHPEHQLVLALAPSDDTWARDHAPLTILTAAGPELLDFRFNGWGDKYPAARDDALTAALYAQGCFGAVPLHAPDLILEGGSIESDGCGTLLTTQHCLTTPTRNPHLSLAGIESELKRWFGASRVLWLENGLLEGDDTDGHIDTLARFCAPDTIAHVECTDRSDVHFAPLQAMQQELADFRDYRGQPYRLIPLPLPAPIHADGRRLPATYANFLIINDAVLVPTYADPADRIALERLQRAFPNREIVGIDCREIIRQGGSLHCLTMQYPAGVLATAPLPRPIIPGC